MRYGADSGRNHAWLPSTRRRLGTDPLDDEYWINLVVVHLRRFFPVSRVLTCSFPSKSVFQFDHWTRTSASPVLSC